MTRSLLRTTGGVVIVLVVLAAAGVLGYVETRAARTPATSAPVLRLPPAAAAVLAATRARPTAPATDAAGALPAADALSAAVLPALHASALGTSVHAEVIDVDSGRILLADGAQVPGAPASTAKLLVAAAALSTRGPQYRIPTSVSYAAGTLVLVGGGDPTLTAATGATQPAYPDSAKLSVLAAAARALPVKRIVVDDAAFTGPITSPYWDRDDVPSSYGAGITAVMTDGGRAAPGDVMRSAAPDLAAGHELAAQLGLPNVPVTRGVAPPGARTLTTVDSAPVSVLVEQMLQESDNVIAECLARQVAMAEHDPVSFAGAVIAIRTVVARLGVAVGDGMVDGSGLAARDRLSAGALAGLVRIVARDADDTTDSASDGASPLGAVLAGLPVAGWSGTLDERYVTGSARSAAGVLRAKTGTLTGVSTLAGIVHDRSGRLLAFAILADRTGPTPPAETAIDVAAAKLAACGCS